MEPSHISRLASEILLFIFLHLDLDQLLFCRRVNKQFLEVIDNNQLIWRRFEWIQQDQESFRPAFDMFDQNSRSSLEKVSIQEQNSKDEDLLHLMQALKKSKETLKEMELTITNPSQIQNQVIELLTTRSRLRSLVVWEWSSKDRTAFPLSHFVPSISTVQIPSAGQLQLLWVFSLENLERKHLNSLVSFALSKEMDLQEGRELVKNFSGTIKHLRLGITEGELTVEPLFCPNLKTFEGWVADGTASFLDAPQLQVLVLEEVMRSDLERLASSVEEIWIRSSFDDFDLAEDWNPFLRLCPKLRILKLLKNFAVGFDFTEILAMLQTRKQMAQDGKGIDGIKIISLQKLILPTETLNDEQLERAAEVADEVVDVRDHPEFIEIEY